MEENFWKDRKVLVTGGTGFLGKYLSDALVKNGAALRIIDFRAPNYEVSGAQFFEADIRDKEKIISLSKNMEVVFHLAAMPSIARGKQSDYYQINVSGTHNMLEAALQQGAKKFVHVSSSTVYGIPDEFPLKETSPVHPIGKYGRSKLRAEEFCLEYSEKGLNVSIVRPRVIIGPGRIGIFSILFDRILQNRPVYILGKGDNVFQFTNVLDMTAACIKAAESRESGIFTVGSDQVLTVREELLGLIRHANSKSRIISIPAGLARFGLRLLSLLKISPLVDEQFTIADKNFRLDTSRAKKLLLWKPEYSNLDSLIQAFDWYIQYQAKDNKQYKSLFGVAGIFEHSKMGAFQKNKAFKEAKTESGK
jgi:nucleoside-diphosphate-sugar epimerase